MGVFVETQPPARSTVAPDDDPRRWRILGLLSLAVAAVWIGHIFASTIHDAKHTTDTISITVRSCRTRRKSLKPRIQCVLTQ